MNRRNHASQFRIRDESWTGIWILKWVGATMHLISGFEIGTFPCTYQIVLLFHDSHLNPELYFMIRIWILRWILNFESWNNFRLVEILYMLLRFWTFCYKSGLKVIFTLYWLERITNVSVGILRESHMQVGGSKISKLSIPVMHFGYPLPGVKKILQETCGHCRRL